MRDLVLGGAGLIGSELVGLLLREGHEVTVCDVKRGCDARTLHERAFSSCDRVWFLAWDVGGARYLSAPGRQHQLYRNNCAMAARVFDGLAQSRTPFLFVTSQLAGQRTAYGMTKLIAETWAAELGGKLARLWNVYGWEQPSEKSHVVTDHILSGLTRGRVTCLTNGEERRRLLYKSDCALALLTLFDSSLDAADIAGPEWVSIRSLAEEVARQLDVPVELGSHPGDEVLIDPQRLVPGWVPVVPLAQGIATVIEEARESLASSCSAR